MTKKEWDDIQMRLKTERKPLIVDWIYLYPQSIRFIRNPSEFMQECGEKYGYISFYPERNSVLIGEERLIAKSARFLGDTIVAKLDVHYKHIKKIRILWRG